MFTIETNGFCKRYGDVNAVTDLNLSVEDGSVFGFLGPNGAGKSTTIDVLLGFLTPTSGEVRVLGADPTTDAKAVRSRTGLLTDGFEPYENLTGRQHIDSAIRTKGADDDPDTILGRVGLSPEQAARNAGGYSKGMTQRLALGIALVGEPDLLVLDEPSGGLDPNGIKLLREAIRVENERGATVFFSSHILDHVEQVCDRVGIMRDGSLVATDSIGNLRERLGTCAVEATVERVPDLEDIRCVEGVTDATISGESVHIVCARTEAKIRALVRLDELTTVRNFDTADSSLESLFEAFTDGDEPAGDPTRTEAAVSGGERL
ncbi:copper ABC transporter ATP-binding protein [Haladaptatus sp. R4]|uniref:ABC transporter ATP-binding protein n=1 Tax=Haladaptatus sp. R4 TaxID=1679489 RepID=UPI0007B47D11|nr:ABC transporter ATP-binding protein [Haladaptatus sp. R4]KZN22472.1 copper ABC transporter ATP-binding protein [Haladaptatus sp. R4]